LKSLKQLVKPKVVCASADGFLSGLLPNIFNDYKMLAPDGTFIILGHPKNFSNKSIQNVESFIKNTIENNSYKTIDEL
jgi:hypothetical protein